MARVAVQPPEQRRLAARIADLPAEGKQRQIRRRDREHPPGIDADTRLRGQLRWCPEPHADGDRILYHVMGGEHPAS